MITKPPVPGSAPSIPSPKRLMRPPSTPNLRTAYNSRPRSSSSSVNSSHSNQSSSPTRGTGRTHSPVRVSRSVYQGSISVGVRIKPNVSKKDPWHVSNNVMMHEEFGDFKFDKIFNAGMSNHQVYEDMAAPLVSKLFEGFNCTIFAYGMTGSGKTYTMSGNNETSGIIRLCVDNIFNKICYGIVGKRYEVKVSYLEIYNERIYDLLNTPHDRTPGLNINLPNSITPGELKIRDDQQYGVRVVGLVERTVDSSEELMRCISLGDQNRKTGETDYNARSSRSHAVVLIRAVCTDETTGEKIVSTLSLCDLAGSERATAQQERRKEGSYINKSLLALGTVISKLSLESTNSSANIGHVPYRDSKLTRILQPALSGDSLVATICTIDTRLETSAEAMNTIRFASRAKNIGLTVRKNESELGLSKDQIIGNLRKQAREQQIVIDSLLNGGSPPISVNTSDIQLPDVSVKHENDLLRLKLSHYEQLYSSEPQPLRDPELIEIVDALPTDIAAVLETKLAAFTHNMDRLKMYVSQLEERAGISGSASTQGNPSISELNRALREQEQELLDLNRSIERKDKMIDALRSAKSLRQQIVGFASRGQSHANQTFSNSETTPAVLQPLPNEVNKPLHTDKLQTMSTST